VDDQPEPAVAGQLVSGNYYSVLGVNAALGRAILPDDDRAPGQPPVCVISHNYWQRRFAGDPSVVGKTIHLGGSPFTIIGVTPREFFGLGVGSSLDITVPMMMQQRAMPGIRSFVGGDRAWSCFGHLSAAGQAQSAIRGRTQTRREMKLAMNPMLIDQT
jgi:MacB-like periplasmic core domain